MKSGNILNTIFSFTSRLSMTSHDCFFCGHEVDPAKGPDDEGLLLPVSVKWRRAAPRPKLCQTCYASLQLVRGRRCPRCGIRLLSETITCTRCRDRQYAFSAHLSLFPYKGLVKELIYQFKFQRLKTFAWLVTDYLARGLTEHFPHLPCIPVPASSVKSSARTNEQPGLAPGLGTMQQIGANLRKAYGCIVYDCLTSLSKAPQKALDFEGRLQNVRGRFSLKKEKTKLSGFSYPPQVVLLDDIFTTGATADECTRVLLTAGVKQVYIMTIAMD